MLLPGASVLMLWNTQVTDAGLQCLVREGTGLKALNSLYLCGTLATDAGIAAVKARWPAIDISR